jgi:hypothetical protein
MSKKRVILSSQKFFNLVQRSSHLDNGENLIEVAEVLDVGISQTIRSENAAIKDSQDRVLLIPEDTHCDEKKRLLTRWSLRPGMMLRIIVEEGKITDIFIIDG